MSKLHLQMLAAGLVCSVLPSCVQFEYIRSSTEEPIAEALIQGLLPGQMNLQQCLDQVGAPLFVWQQANGSIALAYGWEDTSGFGLKVSYTPREAGSISLAYDSDSSRAIGFVLIFDEATTLTSVKRGFLRDLAFDVQRLRNRQEDDQS